MYWPIWLKLPSEVSHDLLIAKPLAATLFGLSVASDHPFSLNFLLWLQNNTLSWLLNTRSPACKFMWHCPPSRCFRLVPPSPASPLPCFCLPASAPSPVSRAMPKAQAASWWYELIWGNMLMVLACGIMVSWLICIYLFICMDCEPLHTNKEVICKLVLLFLQLTCHCALDLSLLLLL